MLQQSVCTIQIKSRILEVIASDQHYVQVKEGLQQGNLQLKFKYYMLEEDGILLYRNIVYVLTS
jgi:hypothetical protein